MDILPSPVLRYCRKENVIRKYKTGLLIVQKNGSEASDVDVLSALRHAIATVHSEATRFRAGYKVGVREKRCYNNIHARGGTGGKRCASAEGAACERARDGVRELQKKIARAVSETF